MADDVVHGFEEVIEPLLSEEEKLLLEIAGKADWRTKEQILALVMNPEWEKAERCCDWRNCVPHDLQQAWCQLNLASRMVAFIAAEKQSSWDSLMMGA